MQVGSVEENTAKMADYLDSISAQLAAEMTQLATEMAHDGATRLISGLLTEALRYASKSPGDCVDTGNKDSVRMPPFPAQYFRPTDCLSCSRHPCGWRSTLPPRPISTIGGS